MRPLDFPLTALPAAPDTPTPTRLDEAAEQFEAMFLRQLLRQMRKAGDVLAADNPLRSAQTDTLREMHDDALADSLARRRQTGIAELLVRQLGRPAPPPPGEATPGPALPATAARTALGMEEIANRVFGPLVEGWAGRVTRGAGMLLRLVERVIAHESAGQVAAVSPKGALGLMQLMPDTAREMAAQLGLVYDHRRLTRDGEYNKRLGTAYLAQLLRRYDGETVLAVAAYNAGPGRVDQWLQQYGDPRRGEVSAQRWIETIPFEETRQYTRRIFQDLYGHNGFKPAPPSAALSQQPRSEYKEPLA
ncbi:transglycosylase SLT domain-containing protein [Pseudomonas sp. HR96]|uniref:lytic transglycosylase domain-containing protein n=1 Tax=Pseudomonas sp. HR96 TaxID=1027966 RepID=UPI002A754EBA|nr:transglycosylase SLT domain-containing protein [Pseudomonas sp. HR96]WPP00080.1 transglycosylase SLT domain-containing protein [Pseudomonas sp. HR96]